MSERLPINPKNKVIRTATLLGVAVGLAACQNPSQPCKGEMFSGDDVVNTRALDSDLNYTDKSEETYVTSKSIEESWGPLHRLCESSEYSNGRTQYREDFTLGQVRYRQGNEGILTEIYIRGLRIGLLDGGTFILEVPGNHSIRIKNGSVRIK